MQRAVHLTVRNAPQSPLFRAGSRRVPVRRSDVATSSTAWNRTWTSSKPFSSSAGAFDAKAGGNEGKQKSKANDNEDSGQAGKNPFSVFVDVLREELQKSREMTENIKQLQGETTKAMDSETMKRMRSAYEKARLKASIKENPRLKAAAEALQRQGGHVNDAVAEAVKRVEESTLYRGSKEAITRAGKAVYDASEPVRQTETYKIVASSVTEALDEVGSNTRYGGFVEKEARRKRREARLRQLGKDGMGKKSMRVAANPEAGENVVLHANASSEATSSTSFRSRLPAGLQQWLNEAGETYRESDNAFISLSRGFTGTMHRWFVAENETARVVRGMKALDPDFQMEAFLRELREYIIPEVVDAFVSADIRTLREWTSEATYNVLTAAIQPYIQKGLISDSRVLDIRGVDIQAVKVLENDVNVFVISFRTQEIINFRDPKTGEIAVGDENKIEQCGYVAVMTRIEEELDNENTGGWKIIDMGRRSQVAFL